MVDPPFFIFKINLIDIYITYILYNFLAVLASEHLGAALDA